MKQKPAETNEIKEAKVKLGQLIKNRRNEKELSLRSLARKVNIPVSNMKYIEDGVNVPGPEKYEALLEALSIGTNNRSNYDSVYSVIRGTPPPDICKIICKNMMLFFCTSHCINSFICCFFCHLIRFFCSFVDLFTQLIKIASIN